MEQLINLGFMTVVTSFNMLADKLLRTYLDTKAEASKEVFSLDIFHTLLSNELRINMLNSNDKSRIENLFIPYHSLLRRQDLSWLSKKNSRVVMYYVLSGIRPESRQSVLNLDLYFTYHALRKDFKKFLRHAIKLLKGFQ